MENMLESCVPPGFRFHPTEEELVGYYLTRKIDSLKIDLDVIVEVDLYKMEPWDIQARCRLGYDEQNEWYFFSHKDRKYPTGTRTNRATAAGFWKATGRDKAVLSKNQIIGMRKTLVFYKGRAPNGRKTDWIMHEYRLQNSEHAPPQEEGWVVCRAFKKPVPNQRPPSYEPWLNRMHHTNTPPNYYFNHSEIGSSSNMNTNRFMADVPYRPDFGSPHQIIQMELPQLDSPSLSPSLGTTAEGFEQQEAKGFNGVVDWKNLDGLIAVQATDSYSGINLPPIPNNFEFETIDSHILGSL